MHSAWVLLVVVVIAMVGLKLPDWITEDHILRLKNVKFMLKLAWVALITDGRSFPITLASVMREESDALQKEPRNEQA